MRKRLNNILPFPLFACGALLVLQQMLQFGVGLDALQLVGDNLPHLGTDAVVVLLNHLHAVVAVGVGEVRDDGDGLVSLFLTLHFIGIYYNLTVKNLLLDALIEVVRHRADEHALRECGNLARGYQALQLRVAELELFRFRAEAEYSVSTKFVKCKFRPLF